MQVEIRDQYLWCNARLKLIVSSVHLYSRVEFIVISYYITTCLLSLNTSLQY